MTNKQFYKNKQTCRYISNKFEIDKSKLKKNHLRFELYNKKKFFFRFIFEFVAEIMAFTHYVFNEHSFTLSLIHCAYMSKVFKGFSKKICRILSDKF